VPAAGVVAYAAASGDRLSHVVLGVGVAGCALMGIALVARRPSVFTFGLAGVGAAYAVFLSLRSGAVDARAPAVAAALFVAAELGFWSFEQTAARVERPVLVRRVAGLTAGAVLTALVGSVVLGLATGVGGSVGLEAVGVAAATLTLAAIALLALRSSA
jgi:hypothetical protein